MEKERATKCPSCGCLRNIANNNISKEKQAAVAERVLAGWSLRRIARDLDIDKATANRHKKLFLAEHPEITDITCACGKPAFHRSWCRARFKLSPARQAFLYERWGKGTPPPKIRLSPQQRRQRAACPWCDGVHPPERCPRIKSIEYHDNGAIRKIEFFDPD